MLCSGPPTPSDYSISSRSTLAIPLFLSLSCGAVRTLAARRRRQCNNKYHGERSPAQRIAGEKASHVFWSSVSSSSMRGFGFECSFSFVRPKNSLGFRVLGFRGVCCRPRASCEAVPSGTVERRLSSNCCLLYCVVRGMPAHIFVL